MLGGVGTAAAVAGTAGTAGGLTSSGVIAGAGMAASAAGGILGAIGSLFSGKSQSAMYNYQAGIAQANATIAKQNANYATAAGEVEAQESGMRTRAQVGATKAGISAGNIEISTGSPAGVISSETEIGQQNAAVIRANAAKRAYGFNVTGAEDVAQAGALRSAASTSTTSGYLGAASSIISAAGSVSSKWLQAGQYGVGTKSYTGSASYNG